jgi:hypothetical protein
MSKIIRNIILVGLVLALGLGALGFVVLPYASVLAASLFDTSTPPAASASADPAVLNARLELVFARQKMRLSLIGMTEANYDFMIADTKILLDKAQSNGKTITPVQAAFDAYKTAFVNAKPLYEAANSILTLHDGFDANGKVTDSSKAKATVKSLNNALVQYRIAISTSRLAMRNAIQTFRLANPRSGRMLPAKP